MRNMSFALTEPQLMDGSKTVTRRLGWLHLKQGDVVQPVSKCMGLKTGEHPRKLGGPIVIVSAERIHLCSITPEDCRREGFPDMSPTEFIDMFCRHMGCKMDAEVTRIEFKRVEAV